MFATVFLHCSLHCTFGSFVDKSQGCFQHFLNPLEDCCFPFNSTPGIKEQVQQSAYAVGLSCQEETLIF